MQNLAVYDKKSVIAIRKMTITPLCHAEKPVLDFFSEGNVDAEGEPCVLAHRDALLCKFTHRVVHAYEYVEAFGVDVCYPTETWTKRTDAEVYAAFEPF